MSQELGCDTGLHIFFSSTYIVRNLLNADHGGNMKKRILAGLTAVVLCISLFVGCSQKTATNSPAAEDNASGETTEEPEAGPELTQVTLNEVAHSIFYAPMYVAIEEGYFEEEGIDLDLVCGFGADTIRISILRRS